MADLQVTFKLTGAKEFERMLVELGRGPAGRAGTNAVRAGARVFERKMKENIRGRGLVLSGRMVDSIKVTDDLAAKQAGLRVAYAGTTLFYAKFSELGSAHQAAKPWARPAVDEGAQEALGAMGMNLGQSIEREAVRLAAKLTKP